MVKVIFEATLTFAVMRTADLYVALVADPANAKELKAEVSTTSVTVIVID